MMWQVCRDALVRTLLVSPFTGLPASLCSQVAPMDSLASSLEREERVCMAAIGPGLSRGGTRRCK
jgi:hypothetical protein